MPSTSGVDLSIAGLASGFDWKTVVAQLAQAERAPEAVWLANQRKINSKSSAFNIVKSYLSQLQTAAQALKDTSIYNARSATSSTATVATATVATASAGTATANGTYAFNISQLATAASLRGAGNVSSAIIPSGVASSVTVGAANFATAVTGGTFSVNGAQVTLATTDTMQNVCDKIATATSNAVTASYDNATDKITLSSASAIVLGSGADTSNFLSVAKLYNGTNTGTIVSTDTLGRIDTSEKLNAADFATAITGGTSGAFTINGVAISFDATADSTANVLDRINNSAAGVTASYDPTNNRFTLANKAGGDTNITLADVTGNFLAASGRAAGALTRGTDLNYTVNGGSTLVSQTNTIDGASSGIAGLSVTALTTGTTNIAGSTDTTAITSALQNFVSAYNNVQSYVTSNAASSTDSTGKVTAGTLTGDVDAANVATRLRSNTFSPVSITGLSATFSQLAGLGIKSNGNNNTVTLDSATLSSALTSHLGEVKNLLADSTSGLAVKLDAFLKTMVGDAGTVTNHQTALTKQSKAIDEQITKQEKIIAADVASWTKAFQAMEQAQAKNNQDLSFLTKNFR